MSKNQENSNKFWIVGKDSRLCFCFVKYSQLVQFPGSVVIPASQNKLFAARSRWVGLFAWPSPGPRFQVNQISSCLRPRFTCQASPHIWGDLVPRGVEQEKHTCHVCTMCIIGVIFIRPAFSVQLDIMWGNQLCLLSINWSPQTLLTSLGLRRSVRYSAQCGCNVLAKFWRLVGGFERLDW